MKRILLKYHTPRMLLTVDLHFLIEVLISKFGESIQLELVAMSDPERRECSNFENGLEVVKERIWLFEQDEGGSLSRIKSLERKVIEEGRK